MPLSMFNFYIDTLNEIIMDTSVKNDTEITSFADAMIDFSTNKTELQRFL